MPTPREGCFGIIIWGKDWMRPEEANAGSCEMGYFDHGKGPDTVERVVLVMGRGGGAIAGMQFPNIMVKVIGYKRFGDS